MVDDPAGVKGYTFGRPGYRYHKLGPVVAADAATARDMVIRCLSPLGGRVFAIDVPLLDGEWLDFLKSGGCGRTPLCAYVPSRPRPPGDSRAAIRHMRPGVRLSGERVRSTRGNRWLTAAAPIRAAMQKSEARPSGSGRLAFQALPGAAARAP